MDKPIPLFLSLTLLTVAVLACTYSTSTVAPTERPTQAPTKRPTPTLVPSPVDPSPVDTHTRPIDGMVMIYVLAGEFQMGSTDEEADDALELCNEYSGDCKRAWFESELPVHTVALDGFWIDKYEVTNVQYQQCVAAGACELPAENWSPTRELYYSDIAYSDSPVIWVDWYQAEDYCEWVGGRLPTEAEWEYAARGKQGYIYPWGDSFDGARLNYCDANCKEDWADESFDDGYVDTAPVGSYPAGASWCGAQDLAGNVWEWTADWYGPYPSGRQVNPTGPSSGGNRVARGGSWFRDRAYTRCTSRFWVTPYDSAPVIGFRCVSPVDSGP